MEYTDYTHTIERLFPTSTVTVDYKQLKKAFYKIDSSCQLLDLYKKNLSVKLSETSVALLKDLSILLKHLLLAIPIEDSLFYHSLMREISETILRICWTSINPEESLASLRTKNYRTLQEYLKSSMSLTVKLGTQFNKFFSLYAKSSNELHAKNGYERVDTFFIDQVFHSKSIDEHNLSQDTQLILIFCSQNIFSLFNITDNDLSHPQKALISKIKATLK